ncbi:helix-turn-helix transcriptional regulator [Vibrio sp. VB16]|uniref:helix-turn-helix transcriptional regulator n=1 Tax=Vibrio sp. VB16 TaxID=2785746 RepID=UPI00189ED3A5|nr:AlpA family phage regulatory protein [Vibrio sp. VB16]UGA53713.1 AlpA family phage regulatory protein [Vibrio sp. VB16]
MKNRLIRMDEVIFLTSLSRPTIYRYMKAKLFPPSMNLGGGAIAWRESDINDWMVALVASRDSREEHK